MAKSEKMNSIETVESLLEDIERALAECGELSDEYKAALERLRQLCAREKTLLSREGE